MKNGLIKKKNLTIFMISHQRYHLAYCGKMFHVPLHA